MIRASSGPLLIVALCGAGGLGVLAQSQQPAFRSSVDSVQLTVSVKDRGRLVLDLGPKEFEVRDNGVVQAFEVAGPESVPIDVTFVVDVSGSLRGGLQESLTRALNAIGQRLGPADRASIVTFNQRVREVRPLSAGWVPLPFTSGVGQTSLFDASTAALISTPEAGHRRMAILFTDGVDTASFVDGSTLVDVAKRADTSLFIVAFTAGTLKAPQKLTHEGLFQTLAESTGGTLTALQRDQEMGTAFEKAFQQFGTGYVLRYTYKGPPRSGWHPVAVHVLRRGTYEVTVRDGYFTGEGE